MCDEPPLDASATHLAQGLVRLLVHPLLHLAHFNATALAAMAHPREQPSSSATVLHACAGRLNSLETGWPVCDEDLQSLRASDCLVYSVGVGGDFSFDDRLADQGCQVHSFDPTTRLLPRHLAHSHDRVHFHPWGLRGGCRGADEKQSFYGAMSGDFLTLSEIVHRLGHARRPPRVLKIDCEGCEWDAFVEMSRTARHLLARVDLLMLELHFGGAEFKMSTDADVARAATFARVFRRFGLCLYYHHMNPAGKAFKGYHPVFAAEGLGAPSYEIGLRRCVRTVRGAAPKV